MSKIYNILDKILTKINVLSNKVNNVIGWYDVTNGTGTSIASSSSWNGIGCYRTLPAGRYILIASVQIGSSSTGTRGIRIYNYTDSEGIGTATQQVSAASSGFPTVLSVSTYVEITSNKEFTVQAVQNSGSSLSISSTLKCIQLR